MKSLLVTLALATGFLLPVQAAANSAIGKHAPTLFHAALINFLVGAVVLAVVALATPARPGFSWSGLPNAPWWGWIAGLIGAGYVAMTVKVAPALGTVAMLAAAIGGQMAGSLTLDHFGWMGLERRPVSLERLGGMVLVAGGVGLILRGR
jgi:bacterial/archaeal transporter family-2 protein